MNSVSDMHSKSTLLSKISTQLSRQQDEEKSIAFMQQAIIIAREIDDEYDLKTIALKEIAYENILQGKLKESLVCVSYIDDDYGKSKVLAKISTQLANQGKKQESKSVMDQALKCAFDSRESYIRNMAFDQIGMELLKQGEIEEAIYCQKEIGENSSDILLLRDMLAKKLAINGQFEESKTYVNGLISKKKSKIYKEIATALANQGKHGKVVSLFIEILQINSGILTERERSSSLNEISIHLLKKGKIKESLLLTNWISDNVEKSSIIADISYEMFKQGEISESSNLMKQSIDIARQTDSSILKILALKKISVKLANQNRDDEAALLFLEALDSARNFPNDLMKNMLLSIFTISIVNEGKIEEALKCLQEISHEEYRNGAREAIAIELFKLGRQEESLSMAREISLVSLKNSSLKTIALELAKVGDAESSYTCACEINDEVLKSSSLIEISFELEKLQMIEKSTSIIKEGIDYARNIDDNFSKSFALTKITAVLFRNGKNNESSTIMDESIYCAREIKDWSDKSIALANISHEFFSQGKKEESYSFIQEFLSCIKMINNDSVKSSNLNKIAVSFAKQGDVMFTEKIGLEITLIAERHACWMELADVMIEQQGWQKALTNSNKFEDAEAQLFYLKGWVEKLKVTDVDDACLKEALPNMVGDNESIENLLQKFALNQVIKGNPPEFSSRLNRSLNIQWALDIVANFPKEAEAAYHFSNVETWIQEIEDENDREDILGWAEKVSVGKMTVVKFQERIHRMI
jgi:tetratricopeptide (TPR) repeat protein